MSIALIPVFEPSIIDLIYDFIPLDEDEDEWETLYGCTEIYETQHYLTYGGSPEGGYVFFTESGSRDGIGGAELGERDRPTSELHQGKLRLNTLKTRTRK